jgi:hypothetical protein
MIDVQSLEVSHLLCMGHMLAHWAVQSEVIKDALVVTLEWPT